MTLNTPEVITAMGLGSGCYLATLWLARDALRRLPLDRVQVPAVPRSRPEPKPDQAAQDAEVKQIDGRRAS